MEYSLGLVRALRMAQRWHGSEGCGVTVKRLPGKGGMWCGASSDFDYMVEGRRNDRQALAKKSYPGPNSFFQFFIFWGRSQDFDFSDFFSGAPYRPQSHGNLPCSHDPLHPSIGPGITKLKIFFRKVIRVL